MTPHLYRDVSVSSSDSVCYGVLIDWFCSYIINRVVIQTASQSHSTIESGCLVYNSKWCHKKTQHTGFTRTIWHVTATFYQTLIFLGRFYCETSSTFSFLLQTRVPVSSAFVSSTFIGCNRKPPLFVDSHSITVSLLLIGWTY